MSINRVARALGWFSIGLVSAEVLMPRQIARSLGMPQQVGLIRAFGLREIGTGIGLLAQPEKSPWLWARVAGDALDLAVLCSAWRAAPGKRRGVAAALGSVLGIAVIDALAGARATS